MAAADELEAELRQVGTAERAASEKAYLKSELEFVGASVPQARAAVAALRRAHPSLAHEEVVALASALWCKPVHERRLASVEVVTRYHDRLLASDIEWLERLLRAAGTWALIDPLAVNVVGVLVDHHPDLAGTLDRWAEDDDFWLRRSALLALLGPLRRGEGDFERFGRYADRMLSDSEFFIRKAIGWVLRDTSRRRPELVRDWLMPRARRASGLTLREATRHLPPADRDTVLAAATSPVSRHP